MYEDIYNDFYEQPDNTNNGNKTKLLIIICVILFLSMIGLLLLLLFKNNGKDIKFKEENITMEIGETRALELENSTEKTITWSSSNNDVAIVDDNGTVSAISGGKSIIIAKQGNKKANCTITVNNKVEPTTELEPTVTPGVTSTPKPTPILKNRCCCLYSNLTMCSWRNNSSKCPSEQPFEDSSLNSCNKKTPTTTPEVTSTPNPTAEPVQAATSTITKYKVSFYDNSNNLYKTIEVESGKEIGDLPIPTRTGYKFSGWYTEKSGGTKITSDTIINENVSYYSRWSGYYKYVFIIGIDGLGATWSKKSSPNFDKIFGNYAYRHNVQSESPTSSAPNWGSILNGVAYSKHKITNTTAKEKTRNKKSDYLTVFYYIRKAKSNAKLVSLVNWQPINHGIIETDIDVNKINAKPDSTLTNKVVDYLEKNKSKPPTLMFVHLDDVDAAAHSTAGSCNTCGGFSTAYYNAAKTADSQLGQIYNKIKSIGILDDSLIIAVADHGETKGGHGGKTTEEKEVLLAVRGKTVNKMKFDDTVRNRDVAAIVLTALGIDVPGHFTAKVPDNLFNK